MNIVFYTDGSFRSINNVTPTYGYSGCGIHGYGFLEENINKSNADKPKNYLITTDGYKSTMVVKKDEVVNVAPHMYFECVISYKEGDSNSSIVELKAIIETFKYLIQNQERLDIKHVKIFTDSSYAELMTNKILKDQPWRDKNTANIELIEQIELDIGKLKDINVTIEILKIKGHDGELGNELVDKLAKIGSNRSKNNIESIEWKETVLTKGIKYWDYDVKQHPLLEFKQLFFSNSSSYEDNINKGLFTILNYPTDVMVGKKTNNAIFGVIKLDKIPPEISSIMRIYDTYKNNIVNNSIVSTCNLYNLYNRDNLYFHNFVKNDAYRFANNNNHLYNILGKPVVYTIKPAVLVVQTLEYMQALNLLLEYYETNSYNKKIYTYIDITEKIYEITKKQEYKVKIPQNENVLFITVEDDDSNEYIIPLELGKDTFTRNQFKHIEKKTPKIVLVLKKISADVISYYTIIDVDDGIGIYCNLYSGKIFLNENNTKKK